MHLAANYVFLVRGRVHFLRNTLYNWASEVHWTGRFRQQKAAVVSRYLLPYPQLDVIDSIFFVKIYI